MLSNLNLADFDWLAYLKKFSQSEPTLTLLLLTVVILGAVVSLMPKSKHKLSTGLLAGTRELINANRVADKQIKVLATIQKRIAKGNYDPTLYDRNQRDDVAPIGSVKQFTPELIRKYGAKSQKQKQAQSRKYKKLPQPNRVTLWCGRPRYWLNRNHPLHCQGVWLQTMLGYPPTTWLADCQQGVLALGPPNSGKTYSLIDSALESAYMQGIPTLLYAAKKKHQAMHYVMSQAYGYSPPGIFAPGCEEGGVINIVDGIEGADDVSRARELAKALNRAMTGGKSSNKSDYFDKAGDNTILGGLLITKHPKVMDMGMSDLGFLYALFSLDNLVERLEYCRNSGVLSEWMLAPLGQILSLKEAQETLQCILSTCNDLFASVIQPSLVQALTGKSTVNIDLYDPRQMLILRLDDDIASVMGPVLAAVMELVVQRNLSLNIKRKLPLIVSLDEVFSGNPPLYLEGLPSWIARYREQGAVFMLGVQDLTQPESVLGREKGAGLIAMHATQALFKAGNQVTADNYSRRYGEQDFVYWTESLGGKGPRNRNQHIQKKPLFTPDQLMTQPEGTMVLENPAYRTSMGRNGRIKVPRQVAVRIPKIDHEFRERCEQEYEDRHEPWLRERARANMPSRDLLVQRLKDRRALADSLFPKPPEGNKSGTTPF
jgi:type IV secretion system protein VirD4